MKTKDFQQLKDDIKCYKNVKDETKKQIQKIRQDVVDQKRFPWHAETLINQLYKDLFEKPERQKFSQLADKTKEDNEFEKYFRSAYLEIFFGIVVNPQSL